MKIERIDDKTVKCFLSNEELEEYDIDYKDFVTRSDKAKEVVQEIIEQAEEEVGYKPPKYAFDLQIMMLPDEGLVLVLSEKEPLENKSGAQLLQALQEMKRVFEEKKAEIGAAEKKAQAGENAGESGKKNKKAAEAQKPQFAILRSAISAESLNMQPYCLQTYASTVLCIEWKMVPVMLMYEKAALPMNVTAEHVSRPWSSQPYMPRMSRSYDTWKSTVNA